MRKNDNIAVAFIQIILPSRHKVRSICFSITFARHCFKAHWPCITCNIIGETIVGDGTTAQLVTLLTGIVEQQQTEARVRMGSAANTVDKWRWIFKDYKENGYVTMFSEDSSRFAAFNNRLKGFRDAPTDHYARPFWLAALDLGWERFCINSKASHKVSFEYLLSYFRAYKNKPKFSFVSLAALSHDSINSIGYADNDFKRFLQQMKEESFLNSTFLVVFGDHGSRFPPWGKLFKESWRNGFHFCQSQHPNGFQINTLSYITILSIMQMFSLHRLICTLLYVTFWRIQSIQAGSKPVKACLTGLTKEIVLAPRQASRIIGVLVLIWRKFL